MHPIIIITISVVIAAFIGGITNHLAIKMLFHPRRPLWIKGWRVPFTPGLIPKRREEIAGSLGHVVAEYLVTSRGLSELLRKEAFQQSITDKAVGGIRRLTVSEKTIGEYAARFWADRDWEEAVAAFLNELSRKGIDWLWNEKGGSKVRVEELLPNWSEERKAELATKAAQYIAEAARKELFSPNGERLLLKMTSQLLEQAGGFLGAMASIFMDEAKVAAKVRQVLSDALGGAVVQNALQQFIVGQFEKAEKMTLGEIAELMVPSSQGEKSFSEYLSGVLRWEEWISRAGQVRVDELVSAHAEWLEEKVPTFVSVALSLLERNVEKIFSAIRLEEMVEAQVREFPIERLEQIILSVSGREFRAITWLGALLGGIIGLMQALLLRWMS